MHEATLVQGLLDMAISLIDVARANGMQEIALEQLEKDVALVQGAQAAAAGGVADVGVGHGVSPKAWAGGVQPGN